METMSKPVVQFLVANFLTHTHLDNFPKMGEHVESSKSLSEPNQKASEWPCRVAHSLILVAANRRRVGGSRSHTNIRPFKGVSTPLRWSPLRWSPLRWSTWESAKWFVPWFQTTSRSSSREVRIKVPDLFFCSLF